MKISATQLFTSCNCEFILGLCALFLVYIIVTVKKKARSNFPPGPRGLPFVGYLPFLTRDVHLDLMQLGKKYGDVFSIKLGSQNVVVLHGADATTEAFRKPEFLGRPPYSLLQKMMPSSAFFGCNFLIWEEQRIPVFQMMKDLGLGKTKIEENVMEEINYFMDVLRKSKSQPINIRKVLFSSLSNNISSLIFGKRYEYEDPKREFLDKNMKEISTQFNHICLDAWFPWISYIPFAGKFLQSHKPTTAIKNFENFFLKELNEHLNTFNPAQVRDFIDSYLLEIEKQRAKNPDTSFNQKMLVQNALDLYIGGSETVETSFLWFIYIIAAFPGVQKQVQKEIMEVIGPDKLPEYMDMRNMPYTRAVMLESMRWKSVTPLNLVHSTLADTTVGGYNLPKGTTVIANLWNIHHDPRNWDEPEKFKPERFLSTDGKLVRKPNYFIPFLLGRRACPGESMAHLELFLYLVSVLQEFNIVFPEGTETTFKGKLSLLYRPERYLIRFIPRNWHC